VHEHHLREREYNTRGNQDYLDVATGRNVP